MNFKLDFSFSPYHVLPKKCNIMHFNNYTSFCNLANDKTLHVTHAKKKTSARAPAGYVHESVVMNFKNICFEDWQSTG